MTDRVARHQLWSELIDDGGDHVVEIGDLVVQLEIASGERLERDAIRGETVAVVGQIGAPCRQRPDELHPRHSAQRVAEVVGGADDGVLDHLQGDALGSAGGLATGLEQAQRLDHPIAGLGRDGALTGEGGVGGSLGVEIVVLAPASAIRLVWRGDLQDLDAGGLEVVQQTRAIKCRSPRRRRGRAARRSASTPASADSPAGSWRSSGWR
jgi:hypothetical protein